MEEKDLLSLEDAQAYLGVSRATVWNLVRKNQIPRYTIPMRGKRVFFKREDLDRLRQPVLRDPEPPAS